MPDWITQYWIEWIFGIVTAVLVALWRSIVKRINQERLEQKAIKSGLQALLRAQMVNDYNHYSEKGCAPIYAKENFENCWKQYHALGANGVIDNIHKQFMELPSK